MEKIFEMAGDRAVHAMWSVSDGETLVPILSFIDNENTTNMQRLAFSDSEEVMAYGRKHLETNETESKGAAFVVDGYVTVEDKKTDALLVTIKGYNPLAIDCTIALPYRPKSDGVDFAIYRPMIYDYPIEQKELVHEQMDNFFKGIEGHSLAYEVWQKHYLGEQPANTENGSTGEGFGKGEWQMICLSPYLVFLTVAAADGTVDKKEVKALANILKKPTAHPSEHLQKVLAETAGDANGIIQLILEKQWNTIDVLEKIREIIDAKMNEDEGFMFKLSLVAIGQEIAEASGGGFLGMGEKISKEEQGALAAIAHALKVLE